MAYSSTRDWTCPRSCRATPTGRRHYVLACARGPDAWAQRMWQQRAELSDLDADALDILSALWLYQARTPQDDAVADVDERLLAMRELQPKRGGQGQAAWLRA